MSYLSLDVFGFVLVVEGFLAKVQLFLEGLLRVFGYTFEQIRALKYEDPGQSLV